MKKNSILPLLVLLTILIASCGSNKNSTFIPDITAEEEKAFKQTEGDTIQIVNEDVEYEIIIIEPGFNVWLQSVARPEGYYTQSFMENRNQIMVLEWNRRVLLPNRFDPNLYQLQIDYRQGIDYGYEVNYKLYNYFIFFQRKYRQRLGPFIPRI